MRKIIAAILALVLSFTLCACGDKTQNVSDTPSGSEKEILAEDKTTESSQEAHESDDLASVESSSMTVRLKYTNSLMEAHDYGAIELWIVYYFENNELTKKDWYYVFPDDDMAKAYYEYETDWMIREGREAEVNENYIREDCIVGLHMVLNNDDKVDSETILHRHEIMGEFLLPHEIYDEARTPIGSVEEVISEHTKEG